MAICNYFPACTGVVNGPTSSGPNPARTWKIIWSPNHARKKRKLRQKNLAMLPRYFDYIFVHLRQKAGLRPELSPKFLSTLGPNPTRKARSDLQIWHVLMKLQPDSGKTNIIRIRYNLVYIKHSTKIKSLYRIY